MIRLGDLVVVFRRYEVEIGPVTGMRLGIVDIIATSITDSMLDRVSVLVNGDWHMLGDVCPYSETYTTQAH